MIKKRNPFFLVILSIILIICVALVYLYIIRDWICKADLNEKTIETIAEKVNGSEFNDLNDIIKRIENKYTPLGYRVFVDSSDDEKLIDLQGQTSDNLNTDAITIVFTINNHSYDDKAYPSPKNIEDFERVLKSIHGSFRPIFTRFCSRYSSDDYEYYFTPFYWGKGSGIYHIGLGQQLNCTGIIICKNYTIYITYYSYDFEKYNNLNSFLNDLSNLTS